VTRFSDGATGEGVPFPTIKKSLQHSINKTRANGKIKRPKGIRNIGREIENLLSIFTQTQGIRRKRKRPKRAILKSPVLNLEGLIFLF
jgi:hypothetical protein